ncbi:MAG TPA: glycosyl hydrolase family 79 C-terminal domain-containing protein [Solirubrobacteraceae bacterium]|nr:glycosyl hydrolase family 79 C-terminal domain-containing protein [Solirubrobacteraceae bacterium]
MRQPLLRAGVVLVVLAALGWILLGSGTRAHTRRTVVVLARDAPPVQESVTVSSAASAPPIAPSFLGFSVEYQSIAVNAGSPSAPDTVFDRLVTNLNPGQHPVIRIGGDSSDHSWWPVPGHASPGLTFALTPAWVADVAGFARRTDARLILGINLEMNNPQLAAVEARHLLAGIGAAHILQWEVGNEPNLFAVFPWYLATPGNPASGVFVRPRNYSVAQYLKEFRATAQQLPHLPLAGPALGSAKWMQQTEPLIRHYPGLADITYHSYPLTCFAPKGSPISGTIPNLLSPNSSDALAAGDAGFAAQARAAGKTFRVDELNSVSCGGKSGVSDTFASSLWMTDALFAMARAGVSGVNVQDFNGGRYKPFGFVDHNGHWSAHVYPVYYGMQLFADAAPAGSQLLHLTTSGSGSVRAWAARTPVSSADHGATTVTLINPSLHATQTVRVQVPGFHRGQLMRMTAPGGAAAKDGVSLGGLHYAEATTSGTLTGTPASATVTPDSHGAVVLSLPPASAALLTLDR